MIRRLASVALAAVVAFSPFVIGQAYQPQSSVQSTFVTPDKSLSFAFSIPKNEDNDFYFILRVHRSFSWGAVGLGTDDMPGALIFMVYDNRNGESVTFSPRLAYGHYEPEYYPELEVDELSGTGIFDQHMVYQGRCKKNCRTWPLKGNEQGSIDVNATDQKAIWALGMREGFASDKAWEGLKYHEQFGTFTLDMARTHGATGPPVLSENSTTEGTSLDVEHGQKSDIQSTMHAVFMILAIAGLMPLGVMILRLGGAAKWHGLTQAASLVLVLVGLGLGVLTSSRYQRSRHFDSYHQILGMILIVFFLAQFAIGFINHRHYKRTRTAPKYNIVHVWFGRVIILVAIMNGFFGFTFALNRRYGMVLAGLIILICVVGLVVIIGRQWLDKRRGFDSDFALGGPRSPYIDSPPAPGPGVSSWIPPSAHMANFPAEPPPRYESALEEASAHQNIGLQSISARRPAKANSVQRVQSIPAGAAGSAQAPRELL